MAWLDDRAWRYFWHPVCTAAELAEAVADDRPLPVTLLGERIAIAEIGGTLTAFPDRCLHRSTRLSLGRVEAGGLRCAYHGWLYGADGACIEVPAMPDYSIPAGFRLACIEVRRAWDMVWLRLEAGADTDIPGCPAWDDPAFRCVQGAPYTWPTSAGRRLENFVDLSHFPFVHDGSLGDRRHTTVPIAPIDRVAGELRFRFEPDPDMNLPGVALMAPTDYRIWMPFTVNLEFFFPDGERSQLWMAASPLDSGACRSFWFTCRTADRDGDDRPHLDFQDLVLGEDLPVIEAQDPPEIPGPAGEQSVPTDAVSLAYRRWLRELSVAAGKGPDAIARSLAAERRAAGTPADAAA